MIYIVLIIYFFFICNFKYLMSQCNVCLLYIQVFSIYLGNLILKLRPFWKLAFAVVVSVAK